MVFTPHNNKIKVAPRLYMCVKCQVRYGSCHIFKEYELIVNKVLLSSNFDGANNPTVHDKIVDGLLVKDTVVAIDSSHIDTVSFISINQEETVFHNLHTNSYRNTVAASQHFYVLCSGAFFKYVYEKPRDDIQSLFFKGLRWIFTSSL